MTARLAVGLAAAVILAWLAVMERDAHLQKRAMQTAGEIVISGRPNPAGFRGADADFRAARFLNPDAAPDLNRAIMYQFHGRSAQAAALLEDVVRREPENLVAWNVLFDVTRERDPATARRAAAARRRLDPLTNRR